MRRHNKKHETLCVRLSVSLYVSVSLSSPAVPITGKAMGGQREEEASSDSMETLCWHLDVLVSKTMGEFLAIAGAAYPWDFLMPFSSQYALPPNSQSSCFHASCCHMS